MIVPNQIKEHLAGIKASFVGTRDKDYTCDVIRCIGCLSTGHDTVRFFIPEKSSAKTLDNLRSNKIVTLSVTNIFTSESYQFKGRMLTIRPVNAEESASIIDYIQEFDAALTKMGFKPGMASNSQPYDPALAIDFVVEQIFDQTPKVGSGKQLSAV